MTIPAAASGSLIDEHASLRRAVTLRAEPVLRASKHGDWPAQPLIELVNYLQLEVLRQITDEEWLLFRNARTGPDELSRLRRDHLELRLIVDRLTQAAAAPQTFTAAQLARATEELLNELDAHLAEEEKVLTSASGEDVRSTTALGSQPHDWYELTEGAMIDLDRLPGAAGADAAFDRLLRLRPGECVELASSSDPSPMWRRLSYANPGGYRMASVQKGPPRWRIEVVKRSPEPPLIAQPG